MSNSSLISYTKLSPNHSGQRTHSVDRITPHCVVGQLSCETICDCFPAGRGASCNYGIGKDGRIALCVDENNRSWCSSSNANDQRAITIECASDKTEPYAMTDAVYASLIDLCTDICKRYGKTKLLWFADKEKTLAYNPAADEMIITVHRWFANKSCPGDWLYNRLGDLAAKVTAKLGGTASSPSGTLYRVQTGAYTKKANADAQLEKVKAAGFDTYMVQAGGYAVSAGGKTQLRLFNAAGDGAFGETLAEVPGTALSVTEYAPDKDSLEIYLLCEADGMRRIHVYDALKKTQRTLPGEFGCSEIVMAK